MWNHYLLIFEILILATLAAWFLRPKVNATFDLHKSQIETHAASRKIALFEEDFYIHDQELAENVTANIARSRRVQISDTLLDTDALRRHSRNPFAPRPSYSLYGAGPRLSPTMSRNPPSYKNSLNPSSLDVPKISVITTLDRSGRQSMSAAGNNRLSVSSLAVGNNRLSVSSSVGGENKRKLSLLDVQYLPKQISQGPWLKRLPSHSVSSDDSKLNRHRVMSITEDVEDEEEVFHEEPNNELYRSEAELEPPTVLQSRSPDNSLKDIKQNGGPTVSVTEYLI